MCYELQGTHNLLVIPKNHTISFPLVDILLHLKIQVISTKMGATDKELFHIIFTE